MFRLSSVPIMSRRAMPESGIASGVLCCVLVSDRVVYRTLRATVIANPSARSGLRRARPEVYIIHRGTSVVKNDRIGRFVTFMTIIYFIDLPSEGCQGVTQH